MKNPKLALAGAMTALVMLGSAGALAQTVYRTVGPDGKVTYSDKAPSAAPNVTARSANGSAVDVDQPGSRLPYALRQIVTRYPVTLYSSAGCVPCNAGRMMLQSRGIPYTEYSIASNEDIEALQRLSGDKSLPFLTIGGQKIKGYSEAEWTQFLNAANYPAASQLPANFQFSAAKPLVSTQKLAPAPESADARPREEEPAAAAAAPAAGPSPSNPTGIKF